MGMTPVREPLPFAPTAASLRRSADQHQHGRLALRDANEDIRRRWARRAILTFPTGTRAAVWFADHRGGAPVNLPSTAAPEVETARKVTVDASPTGATPPRCVGPIPG